MSKKINLSILSPTYQNEEYITQVVKEIYKDVVSRFRGFCEVIIYEAGSTDQTRRILVDLQKKFPFKLIKTPKRVGYIIQVKKLYHLARGEIIFFLDSDGECPPGEFWQLYKIYQNGKYDIITGVRKNRKPLYRSIITKLDNFLIRNLFGLKIYDANCAFRIVKSELGKKLITKCGSLKHNFNAEQLILANKKGLKITEVSIVHRPRKSVVSPPYRLLKIIFKAIWELIIYKYKFDKI